MSTGSADGFERKMNILCSSSEKASRFFVVRLILQYKNIKLEGYREFFIKQLHAKPPGHKHYFSVNLFIPFSHCAL